MSNAPKKPLDYYTPKSNIPVAQVTIQLPPIEGPFDTEVLQTKDNVVAQAVSTALQRSGIPSQIDHRKTYSPGNNPLGMVRVLVQAAVATQAKPIADEAVARRNKVRNLLKSDKPGPSGHADKGPWIHGGIDSIDLG